MLQKEIEVILTRQLASYLAVPILVVDPEGTLIYYNEPAELILGRRFEETGEMPVSQWPALFRPTDEQGAPIPPDKLPTANAVRWRQPRHHSFWICGLDEVRRHIEVIALPIIGQAGRFLGVVSFFWEYPQ